MLHTIENEKLRCTITSQGAEIRSLKNKETQEEYIWQIDANVWGSSSPVLFPVIGNVKDDVLIFNQKTYAMSKHGIIRNNNKLRFEQLQVSECSFTLTSSNETLKQYPFKFEFAVTYSLIDNRLVMTYTIKNLDTLPMHFACGGHTAYACPLKHNTQLSDYIIEFPTSKNLKSDTLGLSGLLSGQIRTIESQDGKLSLSDTLFDADALIFPNVPFNWVKLRKKNADKGIIVRFEGYPHLALWSKPKADYVCIEPWLGLPDSESESTDITQKPTLKTIIPYESFSIAIETEIE